MAERKLLHLRRDDRCSSCGVGLPAGIEAYWLKTERVVVCRGCGDDPKPAPAPVVAESTPGASAQQIYERLRETREERARERHGRIGGWVARMSSGPQHERAWALGAAGEQENALRLAKRLDGEPVKLIHDRRRPGKRSNIDHLAIGPGGVTVIDSKKLTGKVRVDWHGGLFSERQYDLYVNGRRRTKLVEGVEEQVDAVRQVLADEGLADVSVVGALCMADPEGLPLLKRLQIREIAIAGPRRVAELAKRPGPLDEGAIERLELVLNRHLPPA